jgi:hypothetical protein
MQTPFYRQKLTHSISLKRKVLKASLLNSLREKHNRGTKARKGSSTASKSVRDSDAEYHVEVWPCGAPGGRLLETATHTIWSWEATYQRHLGPLQIDREKEERIPRCDEAAREKAHNQD